MKAQAVTANELHEALLKATAARQKDRDAIVSFLSTPRAERALRTAQLDASQVKTAVAALNDQELSRLAARAEKAQSDFAAGALSERDLLLILVGLAALILIIVAVR
ncbi:MAG: hypothetical protein SFV54_17585 [Bryobacteraceae bacterium]|nr:hypothetical protein [Bryobacteraceae bacterium]